MKFKLFEQTWDGTLSENRILRAVAIGQTVGIALLSLVILVRGEVAVITPSEMTEPMRVTMNKASDSYKRAWGLHIAQLVGNLTPSNIDFVLSSIGNVLSPPVYEEFKVQAVRESTNLKKNGYSISFTPNSVVYEAETNKVFVVGRQRIESAITSIRSNQPVSEQFVRTFEVIVDVRNGKPVVLALTSYEGEPRLKRALDRMLKDNPKADAESAKVSERTKEFEGLNNEGN